MAAATNEKSFSSQCQDIDNVDKEMIALLDWVVWDDIKDDMKLLFKTWEQSFKKFPTASPPSPVSQWLYSKLRDLVSEMSDEDFIAKHMPSWSSMKDDKSKLEMYCCDLSGDMRYSPSSYLLERMYQIASARLSSL